MGDAGRLVEARGWVEALCRADLTDELMEASRIAGRAGRVVCVGWVSGVGDATVAQQIRIAPLRGVDIGIDLDRRRETRGRGHRGQAGLSRCGEQARQRGQRWGRRLIAFAEGIDEAARDLVELGLISAGERHYDACVTGGSARLAAR